MRNMKLAVVTLAFLVVLLALHLFAMEYSLYIKYAFLDLILHFVGGVGLALSLLYILKNPKHIIWMTLILGIFWEIFELVFDLTGWPYGTTKYNIDTSIDLLMDTLGAVLVWLIIKFKKTNERIPDIS